MKLIKKIAQVGIFFSVGIFMLLLVFRRQEAAFNADCLLKGTPIEQCDLLDKIIFDISNAKYFWVVTTMVLFMLTNLIRAMRWKMMLSALGYTTKTINLLGAIMVGYLVNLGIPRSGEVVKVGLVTKYEDIPLEKVFGTIFTDRIFDVMMLILVMIMAMVFGGSEFVHYLEQNISFASKFNLIFQNPFWVSLFILCSGMALAFIWYRRKYILSTSLGKKVKNLFIGFVDGVKSVKNVSSVSLFILYTLAIWVIYYLMLYLAFFAFQPTEHLGPIAGLVVFVFGSLGVLIPTPGGMGSYHFLVGEALAMYGVNGSDAFSFANIVFFSIQIFICIIFGLISLISLPIINKER